MQVPLFDMAAELAPLRPELDAAIGRVLDAGTFIGGPEVVDFERELAAAAACRYAVGCGSGTDALLALAMALEVGPGDEVVTTPLTFFATVGAFVRLGVRPVFVDVDDETLMPTAEALRAACGPRTRAVVVVHLYGHPAEIPDGPCPVIEDAAHSVIDVPLRGRAAALSFFPTKNLGAFGDAGAILTDDAALADRARLLRSHGARPKYHHVAIGGNFRLDALQAAILRTKLPHLPAWIAARRRHAAEYRALFSEARLLDVVRLPASHPNHGYHQFVIRASRRDELRAHLAGAGIGTECYYPEPLHLQPCFAELGYRSGSLPIVERACRELLALPIHPTLATGAAEYVVDRIAEFYRRW